MFVFVLLFASVACSELTPKFQVLSPNQIVVEVPETEKKLVTFRIGIKRLNNPEENLEIGENVLTNHQISFNDKRLQLSKGDAVNYLLAFVDRDGYQAQTGSYIFDGVYFGRRLRRDALTSPNPLSTDDDDMQSAESRYTVHHYEIQHGGYDYPPPRYHRHEFYPEYNHQYGDRTDCVDRRPPICFKKPYFGGTTSAPSITTVTPQKCCKCSEETADQTTTTPLPDIDIRFRE